MHTRNNVLGYSRLIVKRIYQINKIPHKQIDFFPNKSTVNDRVASLHVWTTRIPNINESIIALPCKHLTQNAMLSTPIKNNNSGYNEWVNSKRDTGFLVIISAFTKRRNNSSCHIYELACVAIVECHTILQTCV